ncbi:uncharacterized protein [Onthophagus taurus]
MDTRGQHSNPIWSEEHSNRIMASNFGKICKRRTNTPSNKLITSLLYKPFLGNKATAYGREHEDIALTHFKETTRLHVSACGLFIGNDDIFFLGASPDGIVIGEDALVEIRCPFVLKDNSVQDGVQQKKLYT